MSQHLNLFVLPSVANPSVELNILHDALNKGLDGVHFLAFVRFGVRQVEIRRPFNIKQQRVASTNVVAGDSSHTTVGKVSNDVLSGLRREQGPFRCHDDVERVVADADYLKDFAGVSGADLHGLAQLDVERLGDV